MFFCFGNIEQPKFIKSSQPEPTPECTTLKEILPKINTEEIKAAPQKAKNIKAPEKNNIVIDAGGDSLLNRIMELLNMCFKINIEKLKRTTLQKRRHSRFRKL